MNLQTLLRPAMVAAAAVLLGVGAAVADERDPLEPFNRAMFQVNKHLDIYALRPLARGYRAVMPDAAEKGVNNFFGNIRDVTTVANDLLQFKLEHGLLGAMRVTVNSTIGVLGVFDVATDLGLEKRNEDFGQTLGYWGVGSGPYLVLPLFGPSTARDAVGLYVDDSKLDLLDYAYRSSVRDPLLVTRAINTGVGVADLLAILDTAAVDGYSFMKEAYFQRREADIADGEMAPLSGDPDFPDDGLPGF